MAEFPALPIFTDALLGDTMHLTTRQFGAYMLMLIVAWRTKDCALPDDDDYLARITRMDRRTWASDRTTVMAFWKKDINQKWFQGRLKDERKYVEDQRNKNVASGRVSALKRKERHAATVQQPLQHKSNQPTPTPTPIEREDSPLPPVNGGRQPRKENGYARSRKPTGAEVGKIIGEEIRRDAEARAGRGGG